MKLQIKDNLSTDYLEMLLKEQNIVFNRIYILENELIIECDPQQEKIIQDFYNNVTFPVDYLVVLDAVKPDLAQKLRKRQIAIDKLAALGLNENDLKALGLG
jgi:broad-specificity NMP kinase